MHHSSHAATRSTTQHHAAPRSATQHHAALRSTTQQYAAPRSNTSTQPHASAATIHQHLSHITCFILLSLLVSYPSPHYLLHTPLLFSPTKLLITAVKAAELPVLISRLYKGAHFLYVFILSLMPSHFPLTHLFSLLSSLLPLFLLMLTLFSSSPDILTSPHLRWKDGVQVLQHLNRHSHVDSAVLSMGREMEKKRQRGVWGER